MGEILYEESLAQGWELLALRDRMEDSDMQCFAGACKALRDCNTPEAYALLKSYINTEDKYKKRCVLEAIFYFPQSAELKEELQAALQSEEHFLLTTALEHLVCGRAWIGEESIWDCFLRNHNLLDGYYYQLLRRTEKSPANIERLISLLQSAKTDSIRIAISECLTAFASPDNYRRLFALLEKDPLPKLRMAACRIAGAHKAYDLLAQYKEDSDGHIRKYVKSLLRSESS